MIHYCMSTAKDIMRGRNSTTLTDSCGFFSVMGVAFMGSLQQRLPVSNKMSYSTSLIHHCTRGERDTSSMWRGWKGLRRAAWLNEQFDWLIVGKCERNVRCRVALCPVAPVIGKHAGGCRQYCSVGLLVPLQTWGRGCISGWVSVKAAGGGGGGALGFSLWITHTVFYVYKH